MSVIIAILVFGFLIATHELGHFLFAKLFKVTVNEFSIGMGPKIISKKWGETVYSFRLIPLGGFCAMEGEDAESNNLNAFGNKKLLERILIIFGGPLFNIITALILSILLSCYNGISIAEVNSIDEESSTTLQKGDIVTSVDGKIINAPYDLLTFSLPNKLDEEVTVEFIRDNELHTVTYPTSYDTTRIGINYYMNDTPAEITVTNDQPGYIAGLRNGDIVIAIDGHSINTGEDLSNYFNENQIKANKSIVFSISRNGEEKDITVTPDVVTIETLGFSIGTNKKDVNFLSKINYGIQSVVSIEKYTIESLKTLLSGGFSMKDLSGPVGIVAVVSDNVDTMMTQSGIETTILSLCSMTILLAINLGVMNLLPIPALDGGRLVFLFIEGIRKKKINADLEAKIHAIGICVLLCLMGIVMIKDGLQLIGII